MTPEVFRIFVRLLKQVKSGSLTYDQFIQEVERVVDETDVFSGTKTNISGNVNGPVVSGIVNGPVKL